MSLEEDSDLTNITQPKYYGIKVDRTNTQSNKMYKNLWNINIYCIKPLKCHQQSPTNQQSQQKTQTILRFNTILAAVFRVLFDLNKFSLCPTA